MVLLVKTKNGQFRAINYTGISQYTPNKSWVYDNYIMCKDPDNKEIQSIKEIKSIRLPILVLLINKHTGGEKLWNGMKSSQHCFMQSSLAQLAYSQHLLLFGLSKRWVSHNKTQKQKKGKKYLGMLEETIVNCVLTTNQTYVSNLKKDNMFDAEAQKNAFKMTYDSVMNVLSADAMKFLNETYNDVPKLIESMIEAQVNKNK